MKVLRLAAGLGVVLSLAAPPLHAAPDEARASRAYEDALARFERRDIDGAIIQAKNALQADPRLLAAQVLLGRALLARGDAVGAEESFNRALALGVNPGELAVPLAQALYDQGRVDALLERFAPEAAPPAQRPELLVLRGHAWRQKGDAAAAGQAFDQALALDPRSLPALVSAAELMLARRRVPEALALADRALAVSPQTSRALVLKAVVAEAGGQPQEALALYERALAAEPANADARVARMALLLGLGRADAAAADAAYFARHLATEPRGLYLRAVLAAQRKDDAATRDLLAELTRLLDPVPIEALKRRAPPLVLLGALAHYSLGQTQKARAYAETYLKLEPGNPAATKVLAAGLLAAGDERGAISLLEPLVRAAPGDAQAFSLLASAHMGRRQFDTANAYLERALKAGGEAASAQLHTSAGLSLIGLGERELAQAQLERALARAPGEPTAATALALLALRQNQPARAVALMKPVVARDARNLAALNLLGVAQAAAGELAAARASYEQAIAADRAFLPARLNLARLELAQGQTEAARARLNAILTEQPRAAQAMSELSSLEERAGRPAEALRWAEKAWLADRRVAAYGARLAELQLAAGTPDKALATAREAQLRHADNLAVLAVLGRATLATGDAAGATQVYRRMFALAGYEPAALVQLAGLQLAARDRDGAAASLERAIEAQPGGVPAQAMMSGIEIARGQFAPAEARARRVLAAAPQAAIGHRLLGDVASARGDAAAALAAYRTALAREASTEHALRVFGATRAAGQGKVALAFLQSWLQTHPRDAIAWRALAEGQLQAGDHAAAARSYEQVLATGPRDAGVLNNLALIAARAGEPRALELAQQAQALAPQDAAIQDTLGWLLVERGELDKGLRHLREARLRDPASPAIRYHLAVALARSGRPAEARAELEQALAGEARFADADAARRLHKELSAR